jgi:hypothetical protein
MSGELFKDVQLEHYRRFFPLTAEERLSPLQLQSIVLESVYSIHLWENDLLEKGSAEKQGFILQSGQMAKFAPVVQLLQRAGHWKALHLVRENVLDIILSGVLHPFGLPPRSSVQLNVSHTMDKMRRFRQIHADIEKRLIGYQFPFFTITYEALLNGTQTFCSIWEYMECDCVPSTELEPWLSLSPHHKPHWEVIENYEELAEAIRGTELSSYLGKRNESKRVLSYVISPFFSSQRLNRIIDS